MSLQPDHTQKLLDGISLSSFAFTAVYTEMRGVSMAENKRQNTKCETGNCFHLLADSSVLTAPLNGKVLLCFPQNISGCHRRGMLCFSFTGPGKMERKWA
jgi:hypothetical protein